MISIATIFIVTTLFLGTVFQTSRTVEKYEHRLGVIIGAWVLAWRKALKVTTSATFASLSVAVTALLAVSTATVLQEGGPLKDIYFTIREFGMINLISTCLWIGTLLEVSVWVLICDDPGQERDLLRRNRNMMLYGNPIGIVVCTANRIMQLTR